MLLKLVDDEQVVVRARAHFRALIPPLVSMLATIAVMMFLIGYLGRPSQPAFVQHYSHIGIFIVWAVGDSFFSSARSSRCSAGSIASHT